VIHNSVSHITKGNYLPSTLLTYYLLTPRAAWSVGHLIQSPTQKVPLSNTAHSSLFQPFFRIVQYWAVVPYVESNSPARRWSRGKGVGMTSSDRGDVGCKLMTVLL